MNQKMRLKEMENKAEDKPHITMPPSEYMNSNAIFKNVFCLYVKDPKK